MSSTNQLRIKLIRSPIGKPKNVRDCVKALGLRKLQHEVLVQDNSTTRGLIHKIDYLLNVEEV